MKKAALHNLGCKVNAYETQSMEQMLKEAGYEIVDFEKDRADVYIINTCSVTNIADRKSRQMLHKAKKKNPSAVVVAAGCYVQAASEDVLKDASVDIVIGNNKKIDLISILEEYWKRKELPGQSGSDNESAQTDSVEFDGCRNVIDINHTNEYENLEIETVSEHTRAYIKVQDGCNQFCTYCIIPYTRGRIRSRKLNDVLREVKRLVANGYKEVVLTGIHLSSYGLDMPKEEQVTLIELIEEVGKISGIERIRLGSLEPRIVTAEFAQRLVKVKQICPHFHLSLQSGCDATLKRMNRKYDTKEYEKGCRILREFFDNPAITTDVIVGFPDETEEEFDETVEFLKKIHFFEMHIFKYSRRKGTVADKMPGQIADEIKGRRSDVLIELEEEMSKEYRMSFVGKKCAVLFEEKVTIDGEAYFIGHTDAYVKTAVKTDENLENQIRMVKITKLLAKDVMLGEI